MKFTVVTKIPKLDVLLERDPSQLDGLRTSDPEALARLQGAARRHHRSVEIVVEALRAASCEVVQVPRSRFDGPAEGSDVVVAVGGDGTVLDVSHRTIGLPLLGVNSDPDLSVGYFCACAADDFSRLLPGLLNDSICRIRLSRMGLERNGERFAFPCMNDLLVTNDNPAMMSRYVIEAGSRSEQHASSGIWISTAAGSTAGIRSAGGSVLPLEGDLIQYLVREPYIQKTGRYELLRGVRHLGEGITLQSRMPGGQVFVDGPYISMPFALGDRLTIHKGPPIILLGMDPELRER